MALGAPAPERRRVAAPQHRSRPEPLAVGARASGGPHRPSMKRWKISFRPSSSTRGLAASTVCHARLHVPASGQTASSYSTSMAKTSMVQVPPPSGTDTCQAAHPRARHGRRSPPALPSRPMRLDRTRARRRQHPAHALVRGDQQNLEPVLPPEAFQQCPGPRGGTHVGDLAERPERSTVGVSFHAARARGAPGCGRGRA
jgi:hypothetical protein